MVTKDLQIPMKRMRFDHQTRALKEFVPSEPFLKGPIPLSWISAAAGLPGKALHVALAVRWLHGMKQQQIKLTRSVLDRFHVSDDATRDALDGLAAAGLISLVHRRGKRALITVIDPPIRQAPVG